jgi:predicted acyl esterase
MGIYSADNAGYDLYRPEINDELQRYFDRYTKNIQNGWETSTPPVRLSLLGFSNSPAQTVVERPEQEYPLARQQLKTMYLNIAKMTLEAEKPGEQLSRDYEAHHLKESLVSTTCKTINIVPDSIKDFHFYFPDAAELAGYPKATLWMSTNGSDDMDVAVQIRKINSSGQPLEHLNYPCPVPIEQVPDVNTAKTLGPQGFLRASHAVSFDPDKSSETEVFYTHRIREPVAHGMVVKLDIPIWPIGMVIAPGEGIMLRVSGHDMCFPETELCRLREPEDCNVGRHVLHAGGMYDSCLTIPVIPPS